MQSRTVLTRRSSLCLHCARNSGWIMYMCARGGWGGSALRAGSPHTTSGPEPAQNRTSGPEPHKWARTAQVGQNRYYTTTPVLFMSGTRLSILFSIGLIFCDISVFSTLLSMMFSPHHKPVILVLNTFLSVCSSSLLITCPYQFNLLRYLIGSLRHSMSLGCVRA